MNQTQAWTALDLACAGEVLVRAHILHDVDRHSEPISLGSDVGHSPELAPAPLGQMSGQEDNSTPANIRVAEEGQDAERRKS
eukprot:3588589-Rhodomonas_salina.4